MNSLPNVFGVFDKETSVSHGQHCKEHSQAKVVHETKVLFDVTTWSIANVESCGLYPSIFLHFLPIELTLVIIVLKGAFTQAASTELHSQGALLPLK